MNAYLIHLPAELNDGRHDRLVNSGTTARDADVLVRLQAQQAGLVCADDWQPFGCGNSERLLIWADEDTMANDDGSRALCAAVREPIA
jgi:hypothetical protein